MRIANELAQAGEYGGFAIKVLDEQGNEVAYVPIGKRSTETVITPAAEREIPSTRRRITVQDRAHRLSRAQ